MILGGQTGEPLPNLQLHHVGMVVAEIAPTSALYCKRLGYVPQSAIIHDPKQQAQVQFLRLPGDQVFLELVAPDTPASPLQAAAAKGQPLHHLCYAVQDIVRACRELQSRGLTVICRPVEAVAFDGRKIAWLIGRDRFLMELVETERA